MEPPHSPPPSLRNEKIFFAYLDVSDHKEAVIVIRSHPISPFEKKYTSLIVINLVNLVRYFIFCFIIIVYYFQEGYKYFPFRNQNVLVKQHYSTLYKVNTEKGKYQSWKTPEQDPQIKICCDEIK